MIHPLLNMTIKGAIWYQGKATCTGIRCSVKLRVCHASIRLVLLSGEANTDYHQEKYNCSFPAMIDDWRMAFHQGSGGQTAHDFPFGFVQVCRCDSFNLGVMQVLEGIFLKNTKSRILTKSLPISPPGGAIIEEMLATSNSCSYFASMCIK